MKVAGEERGCCRHVEECGSACLPQAGAAQAEMLCRLSLHWSAQLSASGAIKGSVATDPFRAMTFDVKFDKTDQP